MKQDFAMSAAECLCYMGDVSLNHGNYDTDEANNQYIVALLLYRKSQESYGQLTAMRRLGDLALIQCSLDDSEARYKAAMEDLIKMDAVKDVGDCLRGLGDVEQVRGDEVGARKYWEEAREWYQRGAVSRGETSVTTRLDLLN